MQDNDGERELVLGNKQLLTIFFAATLLCGVFFAVGYVVGGNSVKSGANTTASTTDSTAVSTDGKREEPTAPVPDTSAPTTTVASSTPADTAGLPSAEPQIRDNPASSTPAPSTPTPTPPPAPVAATPAPAAATYQTASSKTAASSPTGVFLSVPETGASYVQVSATSRPSADSLVKILRDGGLPAILSTSSKPDLFEVLVGPYRTPITLKDAKQKLTDDGYGNLVVHKF